MSNTTICAGTIFVYLSESGVDVFNILSLIKNNHSGWIFSHSIFPLFTALLTFKFNKNWPYQWMRNPVLMTMFLIAFFDGFFEPFLAVFFPMLCIISPASCSGANSLTRFLSTDWFNETHPIQVMDQIQSYTAGFIGIYIMYKNGVSIWKRREGSRYWSTFIVAILSFVGQQNIVMVFWQVNTCLPQFTYSPVKIFEGVDKINSIPVGFYGYTILYFIFFGWLWYEDITDVETDGRTLMGLPQVKQFTAEELKSRKWHVHKMYLEFLGYTFAATVFCAVPIWSFYYQIWAFWTFLLFYFSWDIHYNNHINFTIRPAPGGPDAEQVQYHLITGYYDDGYDEYHKNK